MLRGDCADRFDDAQVGGQILVRIARVVSPPVVLGQFVAAAHGAGQETAAERRIGDDADAMLAADGQDFGLDLALPYRIFALQRGDRRGLRRSEEHTSELQSLMRISYALFCLKKQNK